MGAARPHKKHAAETSDQPVHHGGDPDRRRARQQPRESSAARKLQQVERSSGARNPGSAGHPNLELAPAFAPNCVGYQRFRDRLEGAKSELSLLVPSLNPLHCASA